MSVHSVHVTAPHCCRWSTHIFMPITTGSHMQLFSHDSLLDVYSSYVSFMSGHHDGNRFLLSHCIHTRVHSMLHGLWLVVLHTHVSASTSSFAATACLNVRHGPGQIEIALWVNIF